jgi:helicase required for RNAi-mediated heterochromatin assembly 1
LSAHYELLREDAVRPLRDTICRIRKDPELNEEAFSKSTGIYQDVSCCPRRRLPNEAQLIPLQVYIRAVTCSTRGIALRVTFSTFRAQKKILWEQSKRLITGSLVVLTPASDMFQKKAIVATVAARKLAVINQDPPEIDLFIARAAELEIDPAMKFVMVEERSAYYEADRHTLLALQKMATEPFPLSEHLVGVQPTVPSPVYVKANPTMNLTGVFHNNKNETYDNVDILEGWPQYPQSDLDKSQTAALHRILTKQLSIVQGPPGTGKTFVSVQAIRVMISNMKPGDPPIIVTCQTNHALDQLLRHIAKFEENFVRLGGRSKDKDVIKKRTLFEVRQLESSNPPAGGIGRGPRIKLQQLEKEIELILEPLQESAKGLIDHDVLEKMGLLSSKQADSLVAGASQWTQATLSNPNEAARSPLTVWLGRSLEAVPRPGESQDFGFAPEETDLEYEQLQEIEAENFAKEDEEFDELYGNSYAIADHFTGRKVASLTAERLKNVLKEKDMWKIPENLRGAVYRHLQHAAKKCIRDSLREKAVAYDKQAILRRIGLWEKDEVILRKQKVIGMTTTGFSKYRGLITALQPRVVLIEEAGETREAPVAVTCVSSLQQLVLVGDHQQLRPHCNMSAHENKPYFLNISLFERLVKNSVEYNMLVKQRRMIPEIRRLLAPIYHGAIEDHASVLVPTNRPDVPGMGGVNSFFFSHAWQEQRDEQMSCINRDEAAMIVGFVEHLIYNGMETDDITILTFYNGQRKCILGALRNSVILDKRRFNVVTVDSYQGEENKVVILSLVRSNGNKSIGFLGVENRVCVALSRAQCGFYMFGNGQLLWDSGSKLWRKVLTVIAGQKSKSELPHIQPNRLSDRLPVRCGNHGVLTEITAADEWQDISGGCATQCDEVLSCGHQCPLTCHPFGHDTICCHHQCESVLECGHTCSGMCGAECSCKTCAKVKAHRTKSSEVSSQVSTDSSNSWKSYSEEEQVRYAKALSTMPHDVRSSAAASSVVGERQLTPPRSSVASSSVKKFHLVELIDTSEDSDGVCDIQSLSLQADKSVLHPQQRSSGKPAGNVNLLD